MVLAPCPDLGGSMKYDYDFRPETYWSADAVTVSIAGQWRRARIRQAMSEGGGGSMGMLCLRKD